MPRVADVVTALERLAPLTLAEEWDNVGLLMGDRNAPANRILTCLTLTPNVAEEALAQQVGLVVTHHPILFRGVKRITTDTADCRMLLALAKAGVAVYSAHTAFDNASGGINDQLAAKLGLTGVQPLRRATGPDQCKLVTFVPESDLGGVSDALFAAGAGKIGEYRECSFRVAGTGTFFGSDSTQPTVGQKGRRENVAEWRLEVICPRASLTQIVSALRSAHSYEEPAFDIYPLIPMNNGAGAGRVGELATPLPLNEVAKRLRSSLGCGPIQLVGDADGAIRRIAIACGAAGEFLSDAHNAKADAFVTGEMRFHDYLAARDAGVNLILPGHYATERFAMENLATWLNEHVTGVQARVSSTECDPVEWI
ncbi:MAG: Nif3-like dinuclear metal center hexameric protein [Gemmataceae bacterium]